MESDDPGVPPIMMENAAANRAMRRIALALAEKQLARQPRRKLRALNTEMRHLTIAHCVESYVEGGKTVEQAIFDAIDYFFTEHGIRFSDRTAWTAWCRGRRRIVAKRAYRFSDAE